MSTILNLDAWFRNACFTNRVKHARAAESRACGLFPGRLRRGCRIFCGDQERYMNEQPVVGKHAVEPLGTRIRFLSVSRCLFFLAAFSLLFSPPVQADSNYYRHSFFDNSLTSGNYFYSQGHVSPPSKLALENGMLPVETAIFFTPPNALRFEWLSNPNGGWEATIRIVDFRNRHPAFLGDTLFFWLYSPQPISVADLPL